MAALCKSIHTDVCVLFIRRTNGVLSHKLPGRLWPSVLGEEFDSAVRLTHFRLEVTAALTAVGERVDGFRPHSFSELLVYCI